MVRVILVSLITLSLVAVVVNASSFGSNYVSDLTFDEAIVAGMKTLIKSSKFDDILASLPKNPSINCNIPISNSSLGVSTRFSFTINISKDDNVNGEIVVIYKTDNDVPRAPGYILNISTDGNIVVKHTY